MSAKPGPPQLVGWYVEGLLGIVCLQISLFLQLSKMGFIFAQDDAGRSQVVVTNDPDYIVPLPIAPTSFEDCLRRGRWIIVNMSVWNVHDIRAGRRAVELIKPYSGSVKLGLRPFDDPKEISSWISEIALEQIAEQFEVSVAEEGGTSDIMIQGRTDMSPIWVSISDSKVICIKYGQLVDAEIEELVFQLLSLP